LDAYSVVGLQVVNLFLEEEHPDLFAHKLDDLQVVCEPHSIFADPTIQAIQAIQAIQVK